MFKENAIILMRNGASLVADVYWTGYALYILRGCSRVWVRESNYAAYDFTII